MYVVQMVQVRNKGFESFLAQFATEWHQLLDAFAIFLGLHNVVHFIDNFSIFSRAFKKIKKKSQKVRENTKK